MHAFLIVTIFVLLVLQGCSDPPGPNAAARHEAQAVSSMGWAEWAKWAEKRHPITDDQGHGPNVGSDEWARALDSQLDISDQSGHGPDIRSEQWRKAVERRLQDFYKE